MTTPRPQATETMVIDTVQEIAPGIVEVDEYVVEGGGGSEPQDAGQ
jgi:hypothetical protein